MELFVPIFIAVFVVLAIGAVVQTIRGRKHRPSLGRKGARDWRRGIIKSSMPDVSRGWLSLIGVVGFLAMGSIGSSPVPRPLALLVAAIFALPVVRAAFVTVRHAWHGRSVALARPLPAALGTEFAGEIDIPLRVRPEEGVSLKLSCVHVWKEWPGAGDRTDRTRHRRVVLWSEDQQVQSKSLREVSGRHRVPFSFTLPLDSDPTDVSYSNNRVYWVLDAMASIPGIDYHAQFEVPVVAAPGGGESTT